MIEMELSMGEVEIDTEFSKNITSLKASMVVLKQMRAVRIIYPDLLADNFELGSKIIIIDEAVKVGVKRMRYLNACIAKSSGPRAADESELAEWEKLLL